MTKRLRTILVDDERLARLELRSMLAEYPQIELVGEADCVERAVGLIRQADPDVVFLDVQMPGQSGFDLLERVDASFKVIFATAYDAHAIRAFEVNALDYLLKPISPVRLARAIERLSADERGAERATRRLEYTDRLFLSSDDGPRLLKIDTIVCIRAAGDYSEVYTSDGKKLFVQKAIREWEERLPENYFPRVHRSTVINIEFVEGIEENWNRSYLIRLRALDEPVLVSRRYAGELKARFS